MKTAFAKIRRVASGGDEAGVLGMCPYSMSRGYSRVTIATSRATNAMSTAKSTPRPRVLAPPRIISARNPSTS